MCRRLAVTNPCPAQFRIPVAPSPPVCVKVPFGETVTWAARTSKLSQFSMCTTFPSIPRENGSEEGMEKSSERLLPARLVAVCAVKCPRLEQNKAQISALFIPVICISGSFTESLVAQHLSCLP